MEDYLLPPLFAVPIEDRVTALRDIEHALGQKEAANKDEEEEFRRGRGGGGGGGRGTRGFRFRLSRHAHARRQDGA